MAYKYNGIGLLSEERMSTSESDTVEVTAYTYNDRKEIAKEQEVELYKRQ